MPAQLMLLSSLASKVFHYMHQPRQLHMHRPENAKKTQANMLYKCGAVALKSSLLCLPRASARLLFVYSNMMNVKHAPCGNYRISGSANGVVTCTTQCACIFWFSWLPADQANAKGQGQSHVRAHSIQCNSDCHSMSPSWCHMMLPAWRCCVGALQNSKDGPLVCQKDQLSPF